MNDVSQSTEHRIVSREEWIKARRTLLAREKEHMRAGDALAAERRALPWVRVEREYVFDTPDGKRSLADLFGGCSQLIVHHLMYHPDWDQACDGCTFQADHIDGPRVHLDHSDVRIVAVSRAPLAKIEAYRKRMGFGFPWVSSYGSPFNYDFGVSFTREQTQAGRLDYNFGTITVDPRYISEELPGISVFKKGGAGQVFHTYSTYARGLDALIGAHHYLDITPGGRALFDKPGQLRRHDEYESVTTAPCCAHGS